MRIGIFRQYSTNIKQYNTLFENKDVLPLGDPQLGPKLDFWPSLSSVPLPACACFPVDRRFVQTHQGPTHQGKPLARHRQLPPSVSTIVSALHCSAEIDHYWSLDHFLNKTCRGVAPGPRCSRGPRPCVWLSPLPPTRPLPWRQTLKQKHTESFFHCYFF